MPVEVQVRTTDTAVSGDGRPPTLTLRGIVSMIGHEFPPGENEAEMWLRCQGRSPEFLAIEERSRVKAWVNGGWVLYGYITRFVTRLLQDVDFVSQIGRSETHMIPTGPQITEIEVSFCCMDSHFPIPHHDFGSTMVEHRLHGPSHGSFAVDPIFFQASSPAVGAPYYSAEGQLRYGYVPQALQAEADRLLHDQRRRVEQTVERIERNMDGRLTPSEDAIIRHHATNQQCEICQQMVANINEAQRGVHALPNEYRRAHPDHVAHIAELLRDRTLTSNSPLYDQLVRQLQGYGRGINPDAVRRNLDAYLPALNRREADSILQLFHRLSPRW